MEPATEMITTRVVFVTLDVLDAEVALAAAEAVGVWKTVLVTWWEEAVAEASWVSSVAVWDAASVAASEVSATDVALVFEAVSVVLEEELVLEALDELDETLDDEALEDEALEDAEELALEEAELDALVEAEVADDTAEVEAADEAADEAALLAAVEDAAAVAEVLLVGGSLPRPTIPARSGERFFIMRRTSTWSRR